MTKKSNLFFYLNDIQINELNIKHNDKNKNVDKKINNDKNIN